MEKRYIEGLDCYTKVHNKAPMTNSKQISPIFTSVTKTRFFYYFGCQWTENKRSNNFGSKDFKSILEHIMAYMFMEHYNNWLKYISKYVNSSKCLNTLHNSMAKSIYDEMPIFIVKHPKNSKFIEFYKINNPCNFFNKMYFP